MASDLEEQKKLLLPILQRAEEIQAVEPRMAYYCRLYAIKKGLEIPKPTKEIAGLIKATFAQCEKDKPIVKPNEETDRLYCENFALTVFRRADKVDRAGRADMNTCKAFYAAAIFLQVLEQFLDKGEEMEVVAPDLLEKTRYALWRAAEVRKALREGRQPAPPPDGGMPAGATAGDGGAGDLFAGPAYEQSMPPDQTGMTAPADPSSNLDSIASSTDEFLALPKPPSTVPPAGSTGLMAPAAAAGPRFRPGSRVWAITAGSQDGTPEEGTVGMVLSPAGGPGGQAVYKVALRDRLDELPDSQLAPAAAGGARIMFVAAYGERPVPGSVIAVNAERWPVTYLVQLDDGRTLDTDGGHVSQMTPGEQMGRPAASHQAGHGYPAVGATGPVVLPAAPPLVDAQPPAVQPPVIPPPAAARPGPTPAQMRPPASHQAAAPAAGAGYPYQPATGGGGGSYPSVGGAPPSPYPAASGRPAAVPGAALPAAAAAPAAVASAAAAAAFEIPPPGTFQPSPSAISEAQKYAKYAASSLAFDDVAGSIKYLTDALRLLTQPPSK